MIREQLGFEAMSLVQCTDLTRAAGRRRPAWAHGEGYRPNLPAVLAEFNREDAAHRLALLLSDLGVAASHDVRVGGGRRRFRLHRVVVPADRDSVIRALTGYWRQGRGTLLSTELVGASSPRNAQRATLARAAWRAALLAGGRRLRADSLGVRLCDQEMAAVLVRAGRLLGVTPMVESRPGCLLVTVSEPEERTRILNTLSTTALLPATRRVA